MSSELDLRRQENADNSELMHENLKLKQIIEYNAEFKTKIMRLERTVDKIEKQNQTTDMEPQPQVNHNAKTVPLGNDKSHVILTELPSLQTEVSELEQDDEIDKNKIVEQGLIQDSSIKIGNSGDKSGNMYLEISNIVSLGNSAQHLSHLFKTAIKSRQQES
ncbi:17088_t:CDS:2 [Acaulospora colombiana]|uniref:17088_t:CDS:1 n=1 Tax=Acaulospora colombiana TaxID=27376 RepID=A0ACA9P0I9_9GLOM|nr:17088_t:CDS:2 [Acaulospora colombiana]